LEGVDFRGCGKLRISLPLATEFVYQ